MEFNKLLILFCFIIVCICHFAVADVDIRDAKNAQMHPGVPKWKTGLQDCYFDQKFKRIFEKEGYTNPYIMEVNDQ